MECEGQIVCDNVSSCAHYWILDRDNLGVYNKSGAGKYFPTARFSYSRSKTKKHGTTAGSFVPIKTVINR